MKKNLLVVLSLAIFCFACNDSGSSSKKAEEVKTETPPAANADADKGMALVAKNDCLTCHKISGTLIGPAYSEVAKKYEPTDANISMLADKVMKGGTGVWGQVPMAAHPNVTKEDADLMVKYVLSLKDAK